MKYYKDLSDGTYTYPDELVPKGLTEIQKAEYDLLQPTPSAAQIAAAAQVAQDKADAAALKADAKFQALIAKTPAQCKNWAQNNFPTLTAPEQNDLATLVQCIGILARSLR
jgi:protein-disulfide isomerase-like protein with CxxC motif